MLLLFHIHKLCADVALDSLKNDYKIWSDIESKYAKENRNMKRICFCAEIPFQ